MKKEPFVLVILSVIVFAVWWKALFNFFAQDDFILINHFSQNSLWQDIKNVFGPPQVTHWRPLHNFYFLIAGNLFGKNYFLFHLFSLFVHILASFFIYKVTTVVNESKKAGIVSAIFYALHPAHFVSLFWISGGATMIGFLFLITSFYCYLLGKKTMAIILYVLSLAASEAMIVGSVIFIMWEFLRKRQHDRVFLFVIGGFSIIFTFVKLSIFTSKAAFEIYRLEISGRTFDAGKYYLFRILGLAEVANDRFVSLILLVWLTIMIALLVKIAFNRQNQQLILFYVLVVACGLFPFILIPSHLSPHYMNVSVWGFASLAGIAFLSIKTWQRSLLLFVFAGIAIYNINLIYQNNWVIKRSNLAKAYLQKIEKDKVRDGSTLVFDDSHLSTSYEAYVTLGAGKAIDFWFSDRNLRYCFSEFETCPR